MFPDFKCSLKLEENGGNKERSSTLEQKDRIF